MAPPVVRCVRNRILGLRSHTHLPVSTCRLSLAERVRLLSRIRARPLVRALTLTHMYTCMTPRVESHTFGPNAVERGAFTRISVCAYVCACACMCTRSSIKSQREQKRRQRRAHTRRREKSWMAKGREGGRKG